MDLVTEAQCEAEIVYLRKLVDNYKSLLAAQEPVAYVLFAKNGNVRMFSLDKETAGPDAEPVYRHLCAGEPDGYAYVYPWINGNTVVRFTRGEAVNGSLPLRGVPYWLGEPAVQPNA